MDHYLVMVSDPFRGTVERGYTDPFYVARVLFRRLPGLRMLLRGPATLLAPDVGTGEPDCEIEQNLRGLLADGMTVLVAAGDLALRAGPDVPVRPGMRLVDDREAIASWTTYRGVWTL